LVNFCLGQIRRSRLLNNGWAEQSIVERNEQGFA
jgi:hypothetical protein